MNATSRIDHNNEGYLQANIPSILESMKQKHREATVNDIIGLMQKVQTLYVLRYQRLFGTQYDQRIDYSETKQTLHETEYFHGDPADPDFDNYCGRHGAKLITGEDGKEHCKDCDAEEKLYREGCQSCVEYHIDPSEPDVGIREPHPWCGEKTIGHTMSRFASFPFPHGCKRKVMREGV